MIRSASRSLSWQSALGLAALLAIVLTVGGSIGVNISPGQWYGQLNKPFFNPPNWLFAPVWAVLYIMIAVAGWRVMTANATGWPARLWFVQMLLNWAWTPVFFGLHQIWFGLAVIAALLAIIIAFIIVTHRSDCVSAWLFVPYAAWVGFATLLNLSIGILN
jgi:translocator protein